MSDLKLITDKKSYSLYAGADWPSYEDFLTGVKPAVVAQEIDAYIVAMEQQYHDLVMITPGELSQANQQRQRQEFFDKHADSRLQCRVPWETMGINANGNVFICLSPSWVPKFVGNILDVNDVYTVLNSDIARSIRNEILQGRYFYCNYKISNFLASKHNFISIVPESDSDLVALPLVDNDLVRVTQIPKNLIFDFDWTCNFRCPSCRKELLNHNKHHIIRPVNNHIVEKIKRLVIDQIGNETVTIRWAGGESFISEVYVELMEYIVSTGKPNIRHDIQTNGSYLKNKADLLEWMLPNIDNLRISFDAATAETYHKIRVNGVWDNLLDNVRHVQAQIKRLNTRTKVSIDYVVQLDNYKEIPKLKELAKELGIDKINFQRMWNWGTWPIEEFDRNNVWDIDHPEYQTVIKLINGLL